MRHRAAMTGLDETLRGHEEDLAATVTATMREGGGALLGDVREETRVFLGHRLEKAWRLIVFPASGTSIDASAWVYTKASKIIDAFDRGATIRSRQGKFLAIPTEAAGKWGLREGRVGGGATVNTRGARARVTPAGFERRSGLKLRLLSRPGKLPLLVVDAAQRDRSGRAQKYRGRGRGAKLYGPTGRTIVVFILVPAVRLPKLLGLDAHAAKAGADYETRLTRNWR